MLAFKDLTTLTPNKEKNALLHNVKIYLKQNLKNNIISDFLNNLNILFFQVSNASKSLASY